ncbi:hypothetical protein SAMN05660772_01271 [Pasteurella testudinis DSM 23072]|uniref:Uncharacterized protein n=1 Tax=Pasteurella testudinis DSM 23072 TaxID=1122938 RepID=A0A1W1V6Y6_9PAST|nr:hypothetical protein [Pasteurella testudinis]SMB89026.1 hypothetical protein SAMN05660772_01271 [Pasteurella testudinis DSM 23072]SUB50220.1 Uncharacterised protein [Pasteurella testudinis]
MDKKIDDSPGKIKNLLNSIMELEWFIGFLLLITCLDLYFTLTYGISVIHAVNQWRFYFTRIEDYIYFVLLFSMVFTMIFPAFRFLYIFILSNLLAKIGIDCYERDFNDNRHYKDYKWIKSLELQAIKENNELLLKYTLKREEIIKQRSRVSAKFLAINLFMLIQWLFIQDVENYPVIIKTLLQGVNFAEKQEFLLQALLILGLVIFSLTWLALFFRAFIIPSNTIYYPDDENKSGS